MPDTPNYELELRRLREAAERVLKLDPTDSDHPTLLAHVKESLRDALAGVASKRGEREHILSVARQRAASANEKAFNERVVLLMKEVEEIEREAGKRLSAYELTHRLNQRENIAPPRGFEWNDVTVRRALKAAGRT